MVQILVESIVWSQRLFYWQEPEIVSCHVRLVVLVRIFILNIRSALSVRKANSNRLEYLYTYRVNKLGTYEVLVLIVGQKTSPRSISPRSTVLRQACRHVVPPILQRLLHWGPTVVVLCVHIRAVLDQ